MEFRILGPLEACEDGRDLSLPRGRARALLALLLLHRGQVVSTDRIVDTLWNGSPPATAAKAVQGYVSSLRRSLGPGDAGAGGPLVTRAPGYALVAEPAQVDAGRFELLASEGRRALEDGDARVALARLEAALALWRGPALVEFGFDEFAQHEIGRLEELRLEAIEARVEALLRLGRHADVVGELQALVAEHPLRERLRGQLMLALYRCGRQADALEAYRTGRRLLAGELGLEPGRELQELERGILAHDPALAAPQRERQTGRARPAPPRRRSALLAAVALGAAAIAAIVVLSTGGGAAVGPPPAHGVVAIDTGSGEMVATSQFGSRPHGIDAFEGAVWVADPVDGVVSRLDPDSGEVLKAVGVGVPAVDVAVSEDAVWVAGGSAGVIVRIDPDGGTIAERIDLARRGTLEVPAVNAVAVGAGGDVWAATSDGVIRVDRRTGAIVRIGARRRGAQDVAAAGPAVWVTLLDGRAVRIEARPGSETAEFSGAESSVVAADDRGAWVGGRAGVFLLHPTTATVEGALESGGSVTGLAVSRDGAWVAVAEQRALLRVGPAKLEVEAAIALGAHPLDVTVSGDRVWVTVVRDDPSS